MSKKLIFIALLSLTVLMACTSNDTELVQETEAEIKTVAEFKHAEQQADLQPIKHGVQLNLRNYAHPKILIYVDGTLFNQYWLSKEVFTSCDVTIGNQIGVSGMNSSHPFKGVFQPKPLQAGAISSGRFPVGAFMSTGEAEKVVEVEVQDEAPPVKKELQLTNPGQP